MRTIGSLLLATVLFSGIAVVAGQERSRTTVRRPISSRSSSPFSRLKQRLEKRKRGRQPLRFDDLFETKKVKSAVSEAKKETTTGEQRQFVSPASHSSEVPADDSADQFADPIADFTNPFEDDPEIGGEKDWALDSLSVKPVERPTQTSVIRKRQPIRSSGRLRSRATAVPPVAVSPSGKRFRRGFRPATEPHFSSVPSERTTHVEPIPAPEPQKPQSWSRRSDTATFVHRTDTSFKETVSSISNVELVVPDPVPGVQPEALIETPRSQYVEATSVSLRRTSDTGLSMPKPHSTGEAPIEPHEQVTPPEHMTRSHRAAAIVARGNMNGFKGFCPVALRDRRVLVDSMPRIFVNYGKRTYYFSTPHAREQFVRNPARYAPAANGADVVMLLERSQTVSGRLDHAAWFHNKLYLFESARSLEQFNANPSRYASP